MKKIEQVIVQVVSIILEATGEKLIKSGFTITIIPTEGKIKKFTATAPNNGADQFVVLQYNGKLYSDFTLFTINNGIKKIIVEGKIMSEVDNGKVKTFHIIGTGINDWEINTVPVTLELLESFNSDSSDKKGKLEENYLDPLDRLMGNNKFRSFVETECGDDKSVTSVSSGLFEYLKKRGIGIHEFMDEVGCLNYIFFKNLLELKDLHPDLRPLLNVSLKENKEGGVEKITIRVGALLAMIDQTRQKEVWEDIKDDGSPAMVERKLRLIIASQNKLKAQT